MSAEPPDWFDYAADLECSRCGGEGFVFECLDGCCLDADVGCDICTRPCPECRRRALSLNQLWRVK